MSNIFSNLDPFPFHQYSWWMHTYQFDNYYDNDYLYEHTRITNNICVSLDWVNADKIDKCVFICDRVNQENPSGLEAVIGLNAAPYVTGNGKASNPGRPWGSHEFLNSVTLEPSDRTTIYDAASSLGGFYYKGMTVFEAETQYYQNRLELIMGWISDANVVYGTNVRIGAFLLQSENFVPKNNLDDEVYLTGVTGCYDSVQTRLISTLGGNPSGDSYEADGVDVMWYKNGVVWSNVNTDYNLGTMKFYDRAH
ncbi:hypothetical protein LCGC14_2645370, partial [marine sediment metagenome]